MTELENEMRLPPDHLSPTVPKVLRSYGRANTGPPLSLPVCARGGGRHAKVKTFKLI